jgi:hypothetical protein
MLFIFNKNIIQMINSLVSCANLSNGFENITKIFIKEKLFCNKINNCNVSIKAVNNILKCKNLQILHINSFHNSVLNLIADLEKLIDVQIIKFEKIEGFICGNTVPFLISENKNCIAVLDNNKINSDSIIQTINKFNIKNITLIVYDCEECEIVCNSLNIDCQEIKIVFNFVTIEKIKKLENINLSNLPPLLKKIQIIFKLYAYLDWVQNKHLIDQSNTSIEIIKHRILTKTKIPYSCEILFPTELNK